MEHCNEVPVFQFCLFPLLIHNGCLKCCHSVVLYSKTELSDALSSWTVLSLRFLHANKLTFSFCIHFCHSLVRFPIFLNFKICNNTYFKTKTKWYYFLNFWERDSHFVASVAQSWKLQAQICLVFLSFFCCWSEIAHDG